MERVLLGKLVNTHGLKGEVKIKSNLEYRSEILVKGAILIIEFGKKQVEFELKTHRIHKGLDMVTFDGVSDINEIEKYKGCNVYFDQEEEYEIVLEEDEVLVGQLLDCDVITSKGVLLGKVTEVFSTGSNDILRVKGDTDCLIPYIESVVILEDFDAKVITIEAIEGLLE